MAEKPTAELYIIRGGSGSDCYRLEADGRLLFITHARATVVERAGAKARMQRWLAQHPHEVIAMSVAPPVASSPTDQQELAFWETFEAVLGGRVWGSVERLLGSPTPRPTTVLAWDRLFQAVDAALKAAAKEAVA